MRAPLLLTSAIFVLIGSLAISAQAKKDVPALDKADPNVASVARGVDYLKVEVPKWKVEHPGNTEIPRK